MSFFAYIMASRPNGTLYTGQTDDLCRRVWEHHQGVRPGFTKRYGVKMLVWYEEFDAREWAVLRERRIKTWNRAWKIKLIRSLNPDWRDLSKDLY